VPTWLRAREIKRSPASHSLLDVGFSTFFLNRTNRSGILRGGVIGGLQQEGAWKIACRFNKDELISRIRRIGFFRSRISLSNMDAAVFLSQRVPPVPSKCLIYIDPPYYVKGAYLYQNHYEHRDHVDLARLISKIKLHKWIVSYDNSEHVTKMYKKFEQEEFDINYSARSFAVGKEIMIFSKDLARPAKVYCSERERQKITA
jgi:DNA adenine methylase